MGIQHDQQKAQEGAYSPTYAQDSIARPMTSPSQPPPQPPPQPPRGKWERWFIIGALVVLALALVLGGVFAVQLASRSATQPQPSVTTATATPTPIPTKGVTPTPPPAPPVGTYQPISTLWMSDATTGWARTTTNRFLHTTDGGKTWQDGTPPYPAGMSGQVPPIFTFLGGDVAWVAVSEKQQSDGTVPGVVFRTSDSGHSWQQAILPTSILGVSQIQFINTQDGWILSSVGGAGAGSQAVDLFRTIDGGRTWDLVASAPGSLPIAGMKSGMGWASATTGWITGSIATNIAYLYRTQDGGVSWHLQSLPLGASPVPITQPPMFFSATDGLLPVIISTAQSPGFAVYATHDRGTTWSGPTPPLSTTGNTWAWDFLTMQQGWVVGAGGNTLYKTSDGGQHWTSITPGATFQHISRLDFVSAYEGWAISTSSPAAPLLLKTVDGGQTWGQVSPTPAPFKVIRVDLTVSPTSITGLLCGNTANFAYLATFHIPAGTPGGTIHFSYTLNNGRSQTFATVAVAAGQTSTTFAFTSSGVLPPDHTYPGIAQVMVTGPNTVLSPQVKPAGACVVSGTFQVTSVELSVTPTTITGLNCGTSLTVTYTATFHLATNSPGGTIRFAYTVNNGRSSTPASLSVAPGQTSARYTFVWSGTLPADHTYPEAGGVMVQGPNVISSPLLGPSGACG